MALKDKRSIARAVALLDGKYKGLIIEEAAFELQRRYHPTKTLRKVRDEYYALPGSPLCMDELEGKSHEELLEALERMQKFLRTTKKINSKLMIEKNKDPGFVEARRQGLIDLNRNPDFRKAQKERMVKRHKQRKSSQ